MTVLLDAAASPSISAPSAAGAVLSLDPPRVAAAGRSLSRAAEAVREEPPPEPPDTGVSSAATLRQLEQLLTRTEAVAGDVHALAGVLGVVVRWLREADDSVADALGRLRAEATR